MHLSTERQHKKLKAIPPSRRILYADSTGGLVYLPQYMAKYPRIMCYAMIVKDTKNLDGKGLLINEMVSNKQDTKQCFAILNTIKCKFTHLCMSQCSSLQSLTTVLHSTTLL